MPAGLKRCDCRHRRSDRKCPTCRYIAGLGYPVALESQCSIEQWASAQLALSRWHVMVD